MVGHAPTPEIGLLTIDLISFHDLFNGGPVRPRRGNRDLRTIARESTSTLHRHR